MNDRPKITVDEQFLMENEIPENTQSADEAREQANKLRSELRQLCLEHDTGDIGIAFAQQIN